MCAVPSNGCLSGRARSQAPQIWFLGIHFILSLLRPPAALPQTQHPHPHLLHHHNQLACYHLPFMMHGASSNICLPFTLEVPVLVCDAQGEMIHLLRISWQWGGGAFSNHQMYLFNVLFVPSWIVVLARAL